MGRRRKRQNRRLPHRDRRRRHPRPGWQQCRAHRHLRRQEIRPPPHPQRHPLAREEVRHRQWRRHGSGRAAQGDRRTRSRGHRASHPRISSSRRAPTSSSPTTAPSTRSANPRSAARRSAPPAAASARPTPTRSSAPDLRVADLLEPGELRGEAGCQGRRSQRDPRGSRRGGARPRDRSAKRARRATERLQPFFCNTAVFIHEQIKAGKTILFEGAQGTYLDIDHGTYPYVTSSNTTAGGASPAAASRPRVIDAVYGVTKAYTTRVGEGPCPTEEQAFSDRLHAMGREFGATTGRKRRCGWFDAVLVRYAAIINGFDFLSMTNLDGLDDLETIKICTSYDTRWRDARIPAGHGRGARGVQANLRRAPRLAARHHQRPDPSMSSRPMPAPTSIASAH